MIGGRPWRGALALSALLLLASCTSKPPGRQDPEPSLDPKAPDTLYAVAGPNPSLSDLYLIQLKPVRLQRLTRQPGFVSSVGGSGALIVVSGGPRLDQLHLWDGKKLRPLPGLGSSRAFAPDVSPSGVLAYVEPHLQDSQLKTWDTKTQTGALLLSRPTNLSQAAWGPEGSIALLQGEGDPAPKVLIVRPDGTRQDIDPQVPMAHLLQWGASGRLAVSAGALEEGVEQGTILIDPATGARSTIDGWVSLAWSPDGSRLLVSKVRPKETTLAVVEGPDFATVRPIGKLKVPIWAAAWVR